jgi:hypothetical protein
MTTANKQLSLGISVAACSHSDDDIKASVNLLDGEAGTIVESSQLEPTFFCRGHLETMPIEMQSLVDKQFCTDCWSVVEPERRREKSDDCWQGDIFIHYGKRYSVKRVIIPDSKEPYCLPIENVCLGPVKTSTTAEKLNRTQKNSVTTIPTTQTSTTEVKTVSVTSQTCLYCDAELKKQRRSKLFCSDICRVRYNRAKVGS